MLQRLLPSLLLMAFAQPVIAQTGNEYADSQPRVCDMQTGKGCHIRSRIEIQGNAIREMVGRKKYVEIEQLVKTMCAGQRMTDGQPELFAFEWAFTGLANHISDHAEAQGEHAAWRAALPESTAAALAEAIYWQDYAWNARGRGVGSTVPPEAWTLFRSRLARMNDVLEQSRGYASNCPLWHSLRISNLLERGASRAEIEKAYAAGVQRFPDANHIHRAMARTTFEQWGGSDEEFERLARRAAKLSEASEGFGMYARLYRMKDCNSCDTALRFAPGSVPSWPDIKRGFEDQFKRFPNDLWNRNKLASYACRAGDKATYLDMRARIGRNVYKELWHSSYSPDVCDLRFSKPG